MNISSTKSNDCDSPKTPGGISKSLLTPCRRVGLSRKWKKGSVSPFISPLSTANINKESPCSSQDNLIRKRKKCNEEVENDMEDSSSVEISENSNTPKISIDRTPSRVLLSRKKSKPILKSQKCPEEVENIPQSISELNNKNNINNLQQDTNTHVNKDSNVTDDENKVQEVKVIKVSRLSRNNSQKSNKPKIIISPLKITIKENEQITDSSDYNKDLEMTDKLDFKNKELKCPNNLSKECMVVIQKKIFKCIDTKSNNILSPKNKIKNIPPHKSSTQILFDSDSDDVPLSDLNKVKTDDVIHMQRDEQNEISKAVETKTKENLVNETKNFKNIIDLTNNNLNDEDDDFIHKKKIIVKKLEKSTSTTCLKKKAKENPKKSRQEIKQASKPSSQSSNSIDSDDDFDYSKTRTILIKKTYDKVTKPLKAKSTGSITQKDIDDINARIESKKNLLLAKAMSNETKELRDLIKKWQLGCQKALIELLDLMKQKLDKNVEHSELLEMLKIPPDLVGYDSDNDCFNTPDDASIILSALKID